jgi:hypothetical protein
MTLASKSRWRIWHLLTRFSSVCPANAYSLVIDGQRRNPRIDSMCRDLANGSCWCGRLRAGSEKAEAGR